MVLINASWICLVFASDLSDTNFYLLETDVGSRRQFQDIFSKPFECMSWRGLQGISSKRLEYVFKTCLEHVLKMSWTSYARRKIVIY